MIAGLGSLPRQNDAMVMSRPSDRYA